MFVIWGINSGVWLGGSEKPIDSSEISEHIVEVNASVRFVAVCREAYDVTAADVVVDYVHGVSG
jgi:hypothetical protein